MSGMELNKMYICVGENFLNGYRVGFCGDAHSLEKWLEILFKGKNAIKYFKGYSNKEIIDYIYKNCGKRLEREK